ncbi:MAG: ATP-binding protein [Rivularia sp. ALOHA_DT_140]|nr:ATP-binding protein [Rivularia sp. ALOHA_DT_140]
MDALEEKFNYKQEKTDSEINNIKLPTIRIITKITSKNNLLIRIADNGTGIPQKAHSRIFDPFFTSKPVGKGQGLGLSISYQIIVNKHNGTLRYRTKPGEGTEFWIEIPIKSN